MFQKDKAGKLHLLTTRTDNPRRQQGSISSTACGVELRIDNKQQISGPDLRDMCEVCKGVWHIAYTSVEDARSVLREETNLHVLDRVILLSNSSTLRKMAQARINRLKKDAERERKLRLVQQAYD